MFLGNNSFGFINSGWYYSLICLHNISRQPIFVFAVWNGFYVTKCTIWENLLQIPKMNCFHVEDFNGTHLYLQTFCQLYWKLGSLSHIGIDFYEWNYQYYPLTFVDYHTFRKKFFIASNHSDYWFAISSPFDSGLIYLN